MSEEYTEMEREAILQAKKKALALLEYSDRTEYQLREKLKEGEFPPFAVEEAVNYVRSFHYIDDERYAENYIRGRKHEKSIYEMTQELRKRGVSDILIEMAFHAEVPDDFAAAKNLFIKKYGRKDLEDHKVYEKAFRYLAGKGFRYDDIKKAMEDAVLDLSNGEA